MPRVCLALALGLAAGCAGAPLAPTATEYWPLAPGRFWVYAGEDGGTAAQYALRVLREDTGPDGSRSWTLRWVFHPGASEGEFTVRHADGFLLMGDTDPGRVLPEHPDRQPEWRWEAGGRALRGRVVESNAVCAGQGGRFYGVVVVETGPADGAGEQGRWWFAPGVGPVRMALGTGTASGMHLDLIGHGGPEDLVAEPARGR